jgi:hypothetical protein
MTRATVAFLFCITAPAILSWLAEPASVSFMMFIFILTAPVTIIVALPIVFRAHFKADNLYPFSRFALRSLKAGLIVWLPPFVILAIAHENLTEAIGGVFFAVLGVVLACIFWLGGVWMNPALTFHSRGTR